MVAPFSSRMTVIAVGLLFIAAAVVGIVWSSVAQQRGSESVRRTMEVESRLYRLLSLVEDAETGQRGYLLTTDESYLAPYSNAAAALGGEFKSLTALITDPGQQQALATLAQQTQERLALLAISINHRRAGESDRALDAIRSGVGKASMDRARDNISQMVTTEEHLMDLRQSYLERTTNWLFIGTIAIIMMVIALALIAVVNERRQSRGLAASRNSLALANEKLVQEGAQRGLVEQQLRQSQKMDAIGQLTGGIAHDFNNMLAIVIGSLNILKRRLSRGESNLERFVDSAMEGAERAATLTHRLLAFSRQQPLAPEPIEINKFVAGMSEMLRRTLGENVRLETILAGGLWRTHADGSQLENTLLNLAVNARDSMPDSGRLTIETANSSLDDAYAAEYPDVAAGQYVMVAVSDNGAGMSPHVLAQAFDPFFTTKGVGRGTGLGLSQVHGFVKQSGGHIKIYSEPGQGTTVKLYLPRFLGIGEPVTRPQSINVVPTGNAKQIILVVEDEPRVRHLTVEMLRELGYTVLEADGAASALLLLKTSPEVNLLFTDIVMPEVNGRQLADEAQRNDAALKVLFTSGYTSSAIVHNGVLDDGVQLISKPFTLDQLANKVRGVFDAPRQYH
jgi:signal transduction histidine kinase/CheY-like chemotaxis protein